MREWWRGVTLCLFGIVATLWLGLTGRLGLYIHPRYVVFTVAMSLLAAVPVLAVVLRARSESDHEHGHGHGHGHGHDHGHGGRVSRAHVVGAVAVLVVSGIALIVLPPATLTVATAQRREVNQTTVSSRPLSEHVTLLGTDYAGFRVRDWAVLLQSGADARTLAGEQFDAVGFVTPVPDRDDLFYVARFVVTCCTVDALPVGVPVHLPTWRDELAEGDWVHVTGSFEADPAGSPEPVVSPTAVAEVGEPADPYEH